MLFTLHLCIYTLLCTSAIALSIKYLMNTSSLTLGKTKCNMAIKQQIELASINATPGILPTHTRFEGYIGENVINLSNVQ